MCSACKMGVETMESMLGDEHDPDALAGVLALGFGVSKISCIAAVIGVLTC